MLQNIKQTRGGFTLVEIMIVVAIIALLATLAVPNILRARQRSQATTILEDCRLLDAAKDQWALENNKSATADPSWPDLKPYVKDTSDLYVRNASTTGDPVDSFGKTITVTGTTVKLDSTTVGSFDSTIVSGSFWGAYAPAAAAGGATP